MEDAVEATPSYLGEPLTYWQRFLESEDPVDRRLAVYALGEMGAKAVAATLQAALQDEVSFVRVWAAASLGKNAWLEEEAVRTLVKESYSSAGFVRSLVAWTLGRSAYPEAHRGIAIETALRLKGDPDPSVRAEADLAEHRLTRRRGSR